jgi:hypothetical protein
MSGGIARTSSGAARPALGVPDAIAVAALALLALCAVATFRDYGLGWDDYTHSQMGELLLALIGSGYRDTRALSFVNLYYYGGGFDMAAALAAKISPFDLFETRRLVGAAVGLLGLAATWRTARHLAGPLAGLVALLLLATCPPFYGHMFINAKDAPFAVAMAILLLGLVRAFLEHPQPHLATVALFGVGLGLSIGTRVLGGLSVLYALGGVALLCGAEARALGARAAARRFGGFVLRMTPGLAIGYLVMGLVWPWGVMSPLNPIRALEYFSHFFEKPWREVFAGALIIVVDMPRSYLPTLLALKLPEIFSLLALAGLAGVAVVSARRDVPAQRRAALAVVALAAALPIAIVIVERPAMYNGIRHFMFVLPPLAILGGVAAAWLVAQAARYGRPAAVAAAALFAVGIALPVVEIVRMHPYEYTYFNNIIGGVKGADGRFMIDYWGLSFKQAGQALRALLDARRETPPRGTWKIAVCGPHPPARVALGPQFAPTSDPKDADFAMTLGVYYCVKPDAPVLVEIAREGVVYARVYDIRGRVVNDLLTRPPP